MISHSENINFLEPKQKYKVLVICTTYNHSFYIEETLNSFVKQKTDFPFVCLIIDDASTDGEQEVIKSWMEHECKMEDAEYYEDDSTNTIIVSHNTNNNCTFAIYFLKHNLHKQPDIKVEFFNTWRRYSEYEALCEGDDYWIVEDKLQKQVEFLDSNNEYSACSSNCKVISESGFVYGNFSSLPTRTISNMNDLVESRKFHTASVLIRMRCNFESQKYFTGKTWDTFIWCSLLAVAPIFYSDEVTCAYRRGGHGTVEGTDKLKWLQITAEWADVLYETFYPVYLRRKTVYKNVSNFAFSLLLFPNGRIKQEEKKYVASIYKKTFVFSNLLSDICFSIEYLLIIVIKRLIPKTFINCLRILRKNNR